MFKKIIKVAAIIATTLILFKIGQALAFRERGYIADGGEYLLLLLPLFWKIGKTVIAEMRQMWEELSKNPPEWWAE